MINAGLCKFCGSSDFKLKLVLTEKYRIVVCQGCGLAQTFPPPVMHYEENPDYIDNYLKNEQLFRSFFRPLVKFIKKYKDNGKLLDIGCSTGFLLDEAIKYGYEVEGIELNKRAADYCITKGLKVQNGCLDECLFPDNNFDIVVMSHVLEHVDDLNNFLNEVYRIITPSGLLVLSLPTYKSLITTLLKDKWYGWVPKDHVWHFTPETITLVLEHNSFKIKGFDFNIMYYPIEFNIKSLLIAIIARISGKFGLGDQFYVIAEKQ